MTLPPLASLNESIFVPLIRVISADTSEAPSITIPSRNYDSPLLRARVELLWFERNAIRVNRPWRLRDRHRTEAISGGRLERMTASGPSRGPDVHGPGNMLYRVRRPGWNDGIILWIGSPAPIPTAERRQNAVTCGHVRRGDLRCPEARPIQHPS